MVEFQSIATGELAHNAAPIGFMAFDLQFDKRLVGEQRRRAGTGDSDGGTTLRYILQHGIEFAFPPNRARRSWRRFVGATGMTMNLIRRVQTKD